MPLLRNWRLPLYHSVDQRAVHFHTYTPITVPSGDHLTLYSKDFVYYSISIENFYLTLTTLFRLLRRQELLSMSMSSSEVDKSPLFSELARPVGSATNSQKSQQIKTDKPRPHMFRMHASLCPGLSTLNAMKGLIPMKSVPCSVWSLSPRDRKWHQQKLHTSLGHYSSSKFLPRDLESNET